MYAEWADGQVNKIQVILNAARADHTEAVKTRIESVQQLGGVVDITKTLFEVSKACTSHTIGTGSTLTDNRKRKPHNSRPRHTNSNKLPHLLMRLSKSLILGLDMRAK